MKKPEIKKHYIECYRCHRTGGGRNKIHLIKMERNKYICNECREYYERGI